MVWCGDKYNFICMSYVILFSRLRPALIVEVLRKLKRQSGNQEMTSGAECVCAAVPAAPSTVKRDDGAAPQSSSTDRSGYSLKAHCAGSEIQPTWKGNQKVMLDHGYSFHLAARNIHKQLVAFFFLQEYKQRSPKNIIFCCWWHRCRKLMSVHVFTGDWDRLQHTLTGNKVRKKRIERKLLVVTLKLRVPEHFHFSTTVWHVLAGPQTFTSCPDVGLLDVPAVIQSDTSLANRIH